MTLAVECMDVRFSYRRREALRGFTAAFDSGLVGLLGPNGAGKSTLMSILSTLRRPASGSAHVCGVSVEDAAQVRQLIGFLPQRFDVMGSATVRRNVEYAAWARGIPRADCATAARRALDRTGLTERGDTRARALSGGYRQRLGLACAIVHEPRVLLLDEPTVAIDPVQRIEVRRLLSELAQTSTVLVSTHLVEDIALAGSHVVLVDGGRALFSGTVDELEARGRGLEIQGVSDLEAGYHAMLLAKA